jgi:hypothetical protein
VHPELEGFRRSQVTLDLLHARLDGQHKKVKVSPYLVFKQLVQIVVSAEPREHMYKDKSLDVQSGVFSGQTSNGKSAISLVWTES